MRLTKLAVFGALVVYAVTALGILPATAGEEHGWVTVWNDPPNLCEQGEGTTLPVGDGLTWVYAAHTYAYSGASCNSTHNMAANSLRARFDEYIRIGESAILCLGNSSAWHNNTDNTYHADIILDEIPCNDTGDWLFGYHQGWFYPGLWYPSSPAITATPIVP